MSQIVRCDWVTPRRQDGAILAARDYPLPVPLASNATMQSFIRFSRCSWEHAH